MKIYFDIQYKTAFGEELLLNVEGQDESADSVLMFTRDGLNWSCDIDVPEDTYGHENEMYNVGVSLKEVECL